MFPGHASRCIQKPSIALIEEQRVAKAGYDHTVLFEALNLACTGVSDISVSQNVSKFLDEEVP